MNKPLTHLDVQLRHHPCSWLTVGLLLLHISAFILSFYLDLNTVLRLLFVLLVLVSGWWNWRVHHLMKGFQAVREIAWNRQDGWQITDGNGQTDQVRLLASSIRSPRFIVLRLKNIRGRIRTAIISAYCGTDRETLRRLRLAMQHEEPKS